MKKLLVPIILIIIVLILVCGWLVWRGYNIDKEKGGSSIIKTYQKEYAKGENPKIKINNTTDKTICFSSCYPYYLEKDDGSSQAYRYGACPYPDIAETCMKPGEVKAFEILLDKTEIEKGAHRIAVPACVGCALQESFRRDAWFYSNEFVVK
jgi:hypothetical protein